MPVYKGYAVRAKLTEVENAIANVKSVVSAYRHNTESWPTCLTINEVRNSLGIGLGSIDRILAISVINGVITVTVQNIDPMVNNKNLTLTPNLNGDGSFSWTWGWSVNFPVHLRPRG